LGSLQSRLARLRATRSLRLVEAQLACQFAAASRTMSRFLRTSTNLRQRTRARGSLFHGKSQILLLTRDNHLHQPLGSEPFSSYGRTWCHLAATGRPAMAREGAR